MSNVRTSAGSQLAVSISEPVTLNLAGYQALSFTSVGEIVDMGELIVKYVIVNHNSLGKRLTVKRRGSYEVSNITLEMGRDGADAGQAILKAGVNQDKSYSFRMTLQDGSISYFTAQIASFGTKVGSVDQITGVMAELAIDSDITPGA